MSVLDIIDSNWTFFIEQHPEAHPFHHPAWATLLAECYGFKPFVVAAHHGERVVAGIPLLEVRRPLRSRAWISLPFTDVCQPLADTDLALDAVIAEVRQLSHQAGISSVEIRSPLAAPDVTVRSTAVIHTLALQPDAEAVFQGFHRSQVQRNVKKATREGVIVRRATRRADLTDTFYRLHLQTRQRQGVPVQPRRFFGLLWDRLIACGLGYVLIAEVGNQPVAGGVFLQWHGVTVYKFGASDPEFWRYRPNHLLFWEAIRSACEAGDRCFDFGRTDNTNTGLRDFKRGWGSKESLLQYSTISGRPGVTTTFTPTVDRIEVFTTRCIQHSPEWVCRALGELFYKYSA